MANKLREAAQEKNKRLRESIEKNNTNSVTDVIDQYETESVQSNREDATNKQEILAESTPKRKKRPKTKKAISLSIDEELIKRMNAAIELHGGVVSAYVEEIIRKDLDKNQTRYEMLLKMREEIE